jgi:hypothetical protein
LPIGDHDRSGGTLDNLEHEKPRGLTSQSCRSDSFLGCLDPRV